MKIEICLIFLKNIFTSFALVASFLKAFLSSSGSSSWRDEAMLMAVYAHRSIGVSGRSWPWLGEAWAIARPRKQQPAAWTKWWISTKWLELFQSARSIHNHVTIPMAKQVPPVGLYFKIFIKKRKKKGIHLIIQSAARECVGHLFSKWPCYYYSLWRNRFDGTRRRIWQLRTAGIFNHPRPQKRGERERNGQICLFDIFIISPTSAVP